jgi:hypothetical protein
MAKRRKSSDDSAAGRASQAGRDSAQKIWLAGLGAFERAKSEGPKMFEALVEQGRSLGVKAREGADQAMRAMRERRERRRRQVGQARAGVRAARRQVAQPPGRHHQQGGRRPLAAGARAQRQRARHDAAARARQGAAPSARLKAKRATRKGPRRQEAAKR